MQFSLQEGSYMGGSNAVDVYIASTGTWTTTTLGMARWGIASTAVSNNNMAMLVGGQSTALAAAMTTVDFLGTACSPGFYVHATRLYTCVPCPASYFSNTTSASSCTACAAGTYNAVEGATACTPCAAGQYANQTASSACSACPAGYHSALPGAVNCTACAAGSYSNSTGAATCSLCEPGYVNNQTASSGCVVCPAGYHSSQPIATACIACAAGFYSNSTGAAVCSPCDGGYMNNQTASTSCVVCPAGTYNSGNGQPNCTPCLPGRYTDGPGRSQCTLCTPGSYANVSGSTGCPWCDLGSISPSAGNAQCSLCGEGSYSNETGSTQCSACPAGTHSYAGAVNCTDCSAFNDSRCVTAATDGENLVATSSVSAALSTAQVAGIAISVGAGVIVALVVVAVLLMRRRKKEEKNHGNDLPMRGAANNSYANNGTATIEESTSDYHPLHGPQLTELAGGARASANMGTLGARQEGITQKWMISEREMRFEGNPIGEGAFGVVYKGEWRGVQVAIKKMTEHTLTDTALQDFLAEAALMISLRPHKNVVQILGVCSEPLCLVMEFFNGGSLHSLLHSQSEIDVSTLVQITKGIAFGMLHLHAEKIIHRDLAARNVLLTAQNEPKISDFGMSRENIVDNANKSKMVVGPLKWMAPESLSERVYGTKSDVWAFGVTLFEIYTRQEPYPGLAGVIVAANVMTQKLCPEIPSSAPAVVQEIMAACFAYNPDARPGFTEIVEKLKLES